MSGTSLSGHPVEDHVYQHFQLTQLEDISAVKLGGQIPPTSELLMPGSLRPFCSLSLSLRSATIRDQQVLLNFRAATLGRERYAVKIREEADPAELSVRAHEKSRLGTSLTSRCGNLLLKGLPEISQNILMIWSVHK